MVDGRSGLMLRFLVLRGLEEIRMREFLFTLIPPVISILTPPRYSRYHACTTIHNAVNKYNTAVPLNQVEESRNLNSNVVKHARMNNEYAHMFYSQKSSIENRFVSIDISSFMCLPNL